MIADQEKQPRISANEHESKQIGDDFADSSDPCSSVIKGFPDASAQKHTGGGLAKALSVEYQPFTAIEGCWCANHEKNARSCTW